MPIVGDFTVISGKPQPGNGRVGTFDNPYRVGDNTGGNSLSLFFGTGGKHLSGGLLTMMVRGMENGAANVRINGQIVGRLHGTRIDADLPDGEKTWLYEQFAIPTNVLNGADADNANQLEIGVVDLPGGSGNDQFDDFDVRDIVCFFHQVA